MQTQSPLCRVLLAGSAICAAFGSGALAADVTSDRLANPEPGNWLMNHRSYDSQRYSPLDRINKTNVKSLKLAYAVAIGGTAVNENLEATPLAEDGFLYVVDQWGVLYKIDGRTGDIGRIVWRMDPGQEKMPDANRGAALWGNFVVTVANYPPRLVATDKETGKIAWESNISDGQANLEFTAAPQAVKDKIVIGASGGDKGVRDFIVAVDAATGKFAWRNYVIPAPGEPGSETWKDKNNAWQTGGGAMWVTGSYDVANNQVLWGTGNPIPWSDPFYRPGDNLFTESLIAWNPDTGKMNWYHQYLPGDMWDYDEEGSSILIDTVVGGQPRKIVTHAARNGFLYSFESANGQTLMAKPYVQRINWTSGIDQKTGKPVDYNPNLDVQVYSGRQNFTRGAHQDAVPVARRWQQLLPALLQPEDQARLHSRDVDVQRIDAGPGGHQEGHLFQPALEAGRAQRIRSRRRRSRDWRGQEARAFDLSERERSADHGRRPRLHRLHRRNVRRL